MCPETVVLVISMHDETLYADRVLRAGAQGYIMKQEVPQKMLEAMREVLNGRISVSPKISAKALDFFAKRRSVNATSPIERLSDREFEILQLIGQGRENHGIADQLHLSFKTVHAHRTNIKVKLNLKSDLELIRYSVRWMDSCDVPTATNGAIKNGAAPVGHSLA
jgi:DNA-binding NarL/FixJ family response regulator